ncbi:MAG TPA: ABC transporter ATP-binding protein [Vicinamibacterales bacterium]|jgi:ABC-2 type transport system ATP-binding protein|nr:ABC transporter ATP-binding protein [Vicinamibacterales bacterium]
MQARLEAQQLTKYYSAIPAVRNVSFTLQPGTILGLLGPNGSGKSTTVSMLTGLREPSTGHVRFDDHDIDDDLPAYKARVGYVPEESQLYTFLSGREQLELVGRLRRLPADSRSGKIASLLDLFGLAGAADQPISGYSKGMRQKILLVSALLHDPDVLILDEPESGLDLAASLVLRHLLPLLAARGKMILYSSHVLDYVERLCPEVVVLHRGNIVAEGPVTQLRAMMQRESSLEDVITQLVTTVDPERTARDIADVVGRHA